MRRDGSKGWWLAKSEATGKEGLVPYNYLVEVKEVNKEESPKSVTPVIQAPPPAWDDEDEATTLQSDERTGAVTLEEVRVAFLFCHFFFSLKKRNNILKVQEQLRLLMHTAERDAAAADERLAEANRRTAELEAVFLAQERAVQEEGARRESLHLAEVTIWKGECFCFFSSSLFLTGPNV